MSSVALTGQIESHQRHLREAEQSAAYKRDLLWRAIAFLSDFPHVYQEANPHLRRQLNQGMFRAIFLSDGPSGNVLLAEPFQTLLSADLVIDKRSKVVAMSPDQSSWSDGMPDWLRDHSWWRVTKRRSRGERPVMPAARSLGLGLNKRLLAHLSGLGLATGAVGLFSIGKGLETDKRVT